MNLSEFKVNVDDVNKTITFTKDDVIITQNLEYQSYDLHKAGTFIVQSHDIDVINEYFVKLGEGVYPKIAKFENEVFILLSREIAISADVGTYLGMKVKNTYEDFVIYESKLNPNYVQNEIKRVYDALIEKHNTVTQELKTIYDRFTILEHWVV